MSRAKILIAEDEPEVLNALHRILDRQGGFDVETATDGADALKKARLIVPDLIISDYSMPTVNGFELCKAVKIDPVLSGCMFVVLTGFTDTALKVSGLNLGVDDYLTKPVEAPELLAKVRATLRIKALHDELRDDKEQLHAAHRELSESFDNLLSVFIRLLDLKIPGSSTRGDRLAQRATVMAKRMKIPEKFMRELEIGARLNEIGKLVEIPGDAPEWHYLVASRAILEQVIQFRGAGSIVGAIGEHWDGTGHPEHLLRGQIPMRSRILRVLIDFDTAWERKKERGARLTLDHILEDLKRFVGTRYDPLVVTQLQAAVAASRGPEWHPSKRRIPLKDLAEGMILAEDLSTSSGVKLLSRGAQLTDTTLELILRRHTSDPIIYGACVEP